MERIEDEGLHFTSFINTDAGYAGLTETMQKG